MIFLSYIKIHGTIQAQNGASGEKPELISQSNEKKEGKNEINNSSITTVMYQHTLSKLP